MGTVLSATRTQFNSLHLPMKEERYTVNTSGKLTGCYKSIFTYPIADINRHARTPYYSLPVCVEYLYQPTPASSAAIPRRRVSSTYDNFGNIIKQSEEFHQGYQQYVLQTTTVSHYMTTNWGTQLLLMRNERDEITQTERIITNKPTSDQRNIETSSTVFVELRGTSRTETPWKDKTFTYDRYGRLISQALAWSLGSPMPPGSLRETISKFSYGYSNCILTSTTYDPDNNATHVISDVRIRGGPVIARVLPGGQRETFDYDVLGRMVRHTNELGESRKILYETGPGINKEVETTFLGYQTVKTLDSLNRPIRKHDNGDPNNPNTTRMLEEVTLDSLGRVQTKTDAMGLKTHQSFDSLGRSLSIVDPDSNNLTFVYNDERLETRQFLNGDLRRVTMHDPCSNILQETEFPDSEDTATCYTLTTEKSYDGFQRLVHETIKQSPKDVNANQSSVILKEEWTAYDYESGKTSQKVSGRSDIGFDNIEHNYSRDLFGNVLTYRKKVMYGDGKSYINEGPVTIYDASNRLTELQNQFGQSERSHYNDNGWLVKKTRFDGTEILFSHDACGQITQTTSPENCVRRTYTCKDRLREVKQSSKSMTYDYTLDGTVSSTTHESGLVQTFKLDGFSRVVQESDVFGVIHETEYNEAGRVSKRVCKGQLVEYTYGLASHKRGQLVATRMTGDIQHLKQVTYDGFHRVKQESVQSLDSRTILETQYQTDGQGRLINVKSLSTAYPDLTKERNFMYDGLGQLVQDTVSSTSRFITKYRYDGNHNVIYLDENGSIQQMAYNAIDQRTDPGFQYDTNGRMVTDNTGTTFKFDSMDRLLNATTKDGQRREFGYHADDSLAFSKNSESTANLFHSQGIVNATEITNQGKGSNKTSYLIDGRRRLASFTNDDHPKYFVDQKGSTALLFGKEEYSTFAYTAYGADRVPSPQQIQARFGFAQEFKHPDSNLIYLRSRHYSSDHMSFISMDSLVKENRYAYCDGDPVNFIDPSGHDRWRESMSTVVGVAVTIGVTLGALALSTFLPPVGVTATIAIGAAVGAAANVLGSVATRAVAGTLGDYGWGDLAMDASVGFIIGAVTTGVGIAWRVGRQALRDLNLNRSFSSQGQSLSVQYSRSGNRSPFSSMAWSYDSSFGGLSGRSTAPSSGLQPLSMHSEMQSRSISFGSPSISSISESEGLGRLWVE